MGVLLNLAFLFAGTTSTNPQMLVVGMVILLAGGVAAGYYGLDRFATPIERQIIERTRTRLMPKAHTA
jgi:thiosulfate dehydrogenase [quinone] large subunit